MARNKKKKSRKIKYISLSKDQFFDLLKIFRPVKYVEDIKDFIDRNSDSISEFQYGHRPGNRSSVYKLVYNDGRTKVWHSRYAKTIF